MAAPISQPLGTMSLSATLCARTPAAPRKPFECLDSRTPAAAADTTCANARRRIFIAAGLRTRWLVVAYSEMVVALWVAIRRTLTPNAVGGQQQKAPISSRAARRAKDLGKRRD